MDIVKNQSEREETNRNNLFELFLANPIPPDEALFNLGLFCDRRHLMRFLYMNELYQKILGLPGVIMEFGCRWGQNEAWWTNLRGIYEPYNYTRKIVAFDTFSGFPSVDSKDGDHPIMKEGSYGVTKNYDVFLEDVLCCHENEAPIPHVKKYELIKGDVIKTLPKYLERNTHTLISFAYFDMDIYKPTLFALKAIWDKMPVGAILAFDELNHASFPGETRAVLEFAKGRELRKSQFSTVQAYIIK